LHCLRKSDGKELWAFSARGKVDSSPVVCGDKVVAGSDDGRLYVVGLQDGRQMWSYEIGEAITASPAVADGRIIIGAEDGVVYAFGAKN
jgi:outer membrane protein assembly factor BamB